VDNIKITVVKKCNQEEVQDIALTENVIARYAPASSVTIQHDFDKAVAIISNLEKQFFNTLLFERGNLKFTRIVNRQLITN
jgi:hypothetical protein